MGLALGYCDGNTTTIQQVYVGGTRKCVVEIATNWIEDRSPALLALDAPLGWPTRLGQVLRTHQAGQYIAGKADEIFYRETDRVVKYIIHKPPLYVGADKIAHTALEALRLLKDLGNNTTGNEILLAPEPEILTCTSAIEAYPAATLKAYEISYKNQKGRARQDRILEQLREKTNLRIDSPWLERCQGDNNALDAAICLLAGADFLTGEVIKPNDMQIDLELVKTEGWIWVRYPRHGCVACSETHHLWGRSTERPF